jgi:putative ABC transport system permease protein
MLTLRIAFRNVLRHSRRSALTVLTMFGGFTLAAISIGWAGGTYSHTIDMFTRNRLGHIQIHREGYLRRPSLYKTIDEYLHVGRIIDRTDGVVAWAPRLLSAGLASVGDQSAGVEIRGIDPSLETIATRFDKKVVEGLMFSASSSQEAILGTGLATILEAEVGDSLVIVSQAADGSIANDEYAIVGIARTGDDATDRSTLYLPLVTAQKLLVLEGSVHEIAVIVHDLRDVESVARELSKQLTDRDLAVETWREFAKSFYHAMKADQQGMWIMLLVIMIVVAIGVLNTVLMSVLERTREYGVMRALGTRPRRIVAVVLCEVALMALASVAAGTAAGLVVNTILSKRGVPLPSAFTYGGVEFTRMMTQVDAQSFYVPTITVILSAMLVSLLPALRAARTRPARAMRMF